MKGLSAESEHGHALKADDGVRAVLEGESSQFHLEYPVAGSTAQHWRSMSVTPFKGAVLHGAVVSIEDISERVQMQKQVRELASYDTLTKLPNRRLALERLAQQLVRARRTKSRLALLFIDLDRFKPINDELGHDVGDWLLQAVAQRIQACLRESDTAARMGGDEFVVLVPDLQSVDAATAVGGKIRYALEKDFVTPKGLVLHISCSIGVAIFPDHGDSEEMLLRLGDEAMYRVKRGGRNAVQVWSPADATDALGPSDHRLHAYLRWKPAFATGHPLIDQQHEALFGLANALLDTVDLREPDPAEFDAVFDALLTHLEAHFAEEEAILQAHKSADFASHAELHRALLDRARTVRAAPPASNGDSANGWVRFLVSELVADHVLGADRAFANLFSNEN